MLCHGHHLGRSILGVSGLLLPRWRPWEHASVLPGVGGWLLDWTPPSLADFSSGYTGVDFVNSLFSLAGFTSTLSPSKGLLCVLPSSAASSRNDNKYCSVFPVALTEPYPRLKNPLKACQESIPCCHLWLTDSSFEVPWLCSPRRQHLSSETSIAQQIATWVRIFMLTAVTPPSW